MKNISSKEIAWVRYTVGGDTKYIVSSSVDRTMYYLYEVKDGEYNKISKFKSPTEFEKIIEKGMSQMNK